MATFLGILLGLVILAAVAVVVIKLIISVGVFFVKYAWFIALVALALIYGMCSGCVSGPTEPVVVSSEYILDNGEYEISLEIKELGCEQVPKDNTLTLVYTYDHVEVLDYTLDSEDGRVFVSRFNKSGFDVQITMVVNPTSDTTFTADLEIWVGCVLGECRDIVEIIGE
jgi:hypothetical protein